MFYIDKDRELTTELLLKIINNFSCNVRPKLQRWKDYYDGKHDILKKSYADASKACNRIVTNYCKIITNTYSGYICGKPVSYTSNEDIEDIQEGINYNDDNAENIAWLTNALIYGIGYELQWLDESAKVRYSQVSPLNAFAIYDNTLNSELLYFVRWYDADNFDDSNTIYLEVYSKAAVMKYKAQGLGSTLELVETTANYFNDVPVSVFKLNEDEESIYNSVMALNDAYNELQSAEVDDYQAWVDSYLQLIGVDAEAEDIAEMKLNRVLVLPEGAQAAWLTKNANDTQIVNMLENIKDNIYKVSACPDMTDDGFLAQSGTALAYKLVGFENVASGIVTQFTKAIQRRIELMCNILNLKATEAVWRDVNINFVRNLPVNYTEIIQLVNALKGTVSDKTLLAQIPFIDDIEGELEAVNEQKQANMSLFSFGAPADDEGDNTYTED
jgi:SPP1 family phage portal protein